MTDSTIVCDGDCAPFLHVHASPLVGMESKVNPWKYDVDTWHEYRPVTFAEMIGWALGGLDVGSGIDRRRVSDQDVLSSDVRPEALREGVVQAALPTGVVQVPSVSAGASGVRWPSWVAGAIASAVATRTDLEPSAQPSSASGP